MMNPVTAAEITSLRIRKALGWSLDGLARSFSRTPAEIDLILWLALGRTSSNAARLINGRHTEAVAA